jgi:hypothetical protein
MNGQPAGTNERRFRSRHSLKSFLVALLCAPTFNDGVSSATTLRTVALSGQHAPGMPAGVEFSNVFGLHAPVINGAGRAAFYANLTGSGITSSNSVSIWSEGSNSLALVAQENSQAPGAPSGARFLSLDIPALNVVGQTAIHGIAFGSGVNAGGVWLSDSGTLKLVALEGTRAPGTPSGVNFQNLSVFTPLLNSGGKTAFFASLTGSGVDATNYEGIWSGGVGNLNLVARRGSRAAGTPTGVVFATSSNPVLNAAGNTAFNSQISGPGVTPSNDQGIWSGSAGSLTLVVRNGNLAPGIPGVNIWSLGHPVINEAGKTAFWSGLSGSGVDAFNDEALWLGGAGSMHLIVRAGTQAPGAPNGANFFDFQPSSLVLNAAERIAFVADLIGSGVTGTNDQGIWSDGLGTLSQIARTGSQAAGIATTGVTYEFLSPPVLNAAGQVAFSATLSGVGVTALNNLGIWGNDEQGVVKLIARTGDLLEVAPSDFRTISILEFVGKTGNGDGRPSGFNDAGQVAFYAGFTNGTGGVFVSNVVAKSPLGDFDEDFDVDGADFLLWQRGESPNPLSATDLSIWKSNFGAVAPMSESLAAVPEPATFLAFVFGMVAMLPIRRAVP